MCLSRLLRDLGGHLESLKLLRLQHNVALKRLSLRGSTPSLTTIIPKNLSEISRQETGKITRGDHPRLRPRAVLSFRPIASIILAWASMRECASYLLPAALFESRKTWQINSSPSSSGRFHLTSRLIGANIYPLSRGLFFLPHRVPELLKAPRNSTNEPRFWPRRFPAGKIRICHFVFNE